MNKKLVKQIKNEWRSNLWLASELLLVSVVMWYVVDYIYVQATNYAEPRGFDTSHCYLVKMGQLNDKSPDFIPNDTLIGQEVEELMNRLSRRPEIEAASLSQHAYPYNENSSTSQIKYDTLQADGGIVLRMVTPDFVRVFRYEGTRGETPEQLAQLLAQKKGFLASDNIFERKYQRKLTPLVGQSFILDSDTAQTHPLVAVLKTVRYSDYEQAFNSYSLVMALPVEWYGTHVNHLDLCVRVKPDQDVDFIARLKADSEKQLRIGNIFIADVSSFADIRHNFQQAQSTRLRNYLFGMGFLMLNIFLGLLGVFWFRTQQRRSEIALHKALGSSNRGIFSRLLSEGLLLLALAAVPATVICWNLAHAEMNAWQDGTTLEIGRFMITLCISFALITVMILLGIWFPASRAMKVEPAEALHEE